MSKEKLQRLIEQVIHEELKNEFILNEGDDVVYRAFIQPFKDIIDTAVHSAKSVTTKAGSDLVKTMKMSVLSVLTWMGPEELKNIEKQADERLKKYIQGLDDKYKDVLQRNFDALSSTDVAGFTFFLRPDLFFARKLATGSPAVALDLLDTLTLGNPKVRALKQKVKDFDKTKDFGAGWRSGAGGLGYVDYDVGDGGLEESKKLFEKQNPKTQINNAVKELLKDPEIIKSMKENPVIKTLAKVEAQTVLERAKEVAEFETFEDVKKFAGDDASKLEKEALELIPDEATEEEKQQLLNAQVPEYKKMYKMIYKNYLTNLLNLDAYYPNDIKKVVEKIEQI